MDILVRKRNLSLLLLKNRQTFLVSEHNKSRKKSVILEVPVVDILKKAISENSDNSGPKTPHLVKKPPNKHARSGFVEQANAELDNWIERK